MQQKIGFIPTRVAFEESGGIWRISSTGLQEISKVIVVCDAGTESSKAVDFKSSYWAKPLAVTWKECIQQAISHAFTWPKAHYQNNFDSFPKRKSAILLSQMEKLDNYF